MENRISGPVFQLPPQTKSMQILCKWPNWGRTVQIWPHAAECIQSFPLFGYSTIQEGKQRRIIPGEKGNEGVWQVTGLPRYETGQFGAPPFITVSPSYHTPSIASFSFSRPACYVAPKINEMVCLLERWDVVRSKGRKVERGAQRQQRIAWNGSSLVSNGRSWFRSSGILYETTYCWWNLVSHTSISKLHLQRRWDFWWTKWQRNWFLRFFRQYHSTKVPY